MKTAYFLEQRPPMWWLEASETSAIGDEDFVTGDDVLRLGSQSVRLEDIASYKVEQISERDVEGLLLNGTMFFFGALVFLIGVLQFSWLERFLIGFVFLSILGIASMAEVVGLNRIQYMQLTVFTHSGRKLKFSSADDRDVGRLVDFLRQVVGR
ncbi:MAG: hypothetical protein K0U74_09955 [Alphaproteobacteria bacterium]|nr:hypothetical protein [Alphaproteobacteria bacterium]